ncbi:hypothetical protein CROQUDRAFT_654102 [Cronartium quercuum f. sp. fusiforme G11]|uniref:Sld7 C-terminal domain-containing protein n=1 Tax=Cronartium quercuum f. sp. fusiforme G11 TaxID=708437 RepID=A0A9P6TEM8_9BASI|nr:hypothetical protein CROQUDRAFT_654102 [Cronartium quercuum f. sp. fusiforme G11]
MASLSPFATTDVPSSSNTRLLWRGTIVTHTGETLNGLAIVAHSIDVSKKRTAREDPFDANQPPHRLSATCLELEMLRGRDLQAQGFARLLPDEDHDQKVLSKEQTKKGGRSARLASLLKGKDPASGTDLVKDIPFSEVECDPDVRLYIDPRCSHTRDWMMSHLCTKDLTRAGWTRDALLLILDQTLDDKQPSQLLLYGHAVPDASASQNTTRPIPLQLVIGQRKLAPPPRVPRPDDPMPRSTTSFTEKLKCSAGPRVTFEEVAPSRSLSQFKSRPQEVPPPNPSNHPNRNPFKSAVVVNNPKMVFTRSSIKLTRRPTNTPGRRVEPISRFRHNTSLMAGHDDSMMLIPTEKVPEKRCLDEQDSLSAKRLKSRPTFTRASDKYTLPDVIPRYVHDGVIQDENYYMLERSPSPSPTSFASSRQPRPIKQAAASPTVKLQTKIQTSARHLSVSNKIVLTESNNVATNGSSSIRVGLLPAVPELVPTPVENTSHLKNNKALIRKLALASMSSRGIDKSNTDFKELFAALCRGVQFAMRKELEHQEIDTTLAQSFVEGHLAMYRIMTPVESVMMAMKRSQ